MFPSRLGECHEKRTIKKSIELLRKTLEIIITQEGDVAPSLTTHL